MIYFSFIFFFFSRKIVIFTFATLFDCSFNNKKIKCSFSSSFLSVEEGGISISVSRKHVH